MPQPHEFGVYSRDERLCLPLPEASWRGCNLADIDIVDLGSHWLWAASFQMHGGDCFGHGEPLKDVERWRASWRDVAIDAPRSYFAERLGPLVDRYADARVIVVWLETLRPAQFDLFGMAE